MARRLSTDAKIVLERAGYEVTDLTRWLAIETDARLIRMDITDGTVDNSEVVSLLSAKGKNEYGH